MAPALARFTVFDWAFTPLAAIAGRELLTTLRQGRYGALLITAATIQLMIAVPSPFLVAGRAMPPAEAISGVLTAQCYTLLLVLFLVVPALAAVSLAAERHRQTDDLLRTALFHPATVVAGKLLAVLGVFALFHLALLPFGAFIYFFAGIELRSLFLATLVLYTTALAHALIGIGLSRVVMSPTRSVLVSYGAVLLLYALPTAHYAWFSDPLQIGPMPAPPWNPLSILSRIISSDASLADCLDLARMQAWGVLFVALVILAEGQVARLRLFRPTGPRGPTRPTFGPIPNWGNTVFHRERRLARLSRPASAMAAFLLCAVAAALFDRWSLGNIGWVVDSFDVGAALLYLTIPLLVVERCSREMDPETLIHLRMTLEGSERVLTGLAAALFVSVLPVVLGIMLGGGLPRLLPGHDVLTAKLPYGSDPDIFIYKFILLAPRAACVVVLSLMCVRFRNPSTIDVAVSLTAAYFLVAGGDAVLRSLINSTQARALDGVGAVYMGLGVTCILLLCSILPLLIAQIRFDEVFDTGYEPYRVDGWEGDIK